MCVAMASGPLCTCHGGLAQWRQSKELSLGEKKRRRACGSRSKRLCHAGSQDTARACCDAAAPQPHTAVAVGCPARPAFACAPLENTPLSCACFTSAALSRWSTQYSNGVGRGRGALRCCSAERGAGPPLGNSHHHTHTHKPQCLQFFSFLLPREALFSKHNGAGTKITC